MLKSARDDATTRSTDLEVAQILFEPSSAFSPAVEYASSIRDALAQADITVTQGAPRHQSAGSVAHVFDATATQPCLTAIDQLRRRGHPVVVSPMTVDYRVRETYERDVPRAFAESESETEVAHRLAAVAHEIEDAESRPRKPDPSLARFVANLRNADSLFLASDDERQLLERLGAEASHASVVHHVIDAHVASDAEPGDFEQRYGVSSFILAHARIEPSGNQAMLAHCAKILGVPLVLIGDVGDVDYLGLVRRIAGRDTIVMPDLPPGDPMLASAFAGASVYAKPDWTRRVDGGLLAAARLGIPIVASRRGAAREYLADNATYVDPTDVDGCCDALRDAHEHGRHPHVAQSTNDTGRSLAAFVEDASRAYVSALTSRAGTAGQDDEPSSGTTTTTTRAPSGRMLVDLSALVAHRGNATGIFRVQRNSALALASEFPDRVTAVVWRPVDGQFVTMPVTDALDMRTHEQLDAYIDRYGSAVPLEELEGAQLLCFGAPWIAGLDYVEALAGLCWTYDLHAHMTVHDLGPVVLAHMYPELAQPFRTNLSHLAHVASSFLVYSDSTRDDLRRFLLPLGHGDKPIHQFPIATYHETSATADATPSHAARPGGDAVETAEPLPDGLIDGGFVLFVTTIDVRKNHRFLLDVWRRVVAELGGHAPQLVLVGRRSWGAADVLASLEADVELRQRVLVIHDADDDLVERLFRGSLFTVYPSLHEGWGLPIAESLSHGKVCVASDSSSMREVAPGLVDLVDPHDPAAWSDALLGYIRRPDLRRQRESEIVARFAPTSWQAAMTTLVDQLDENPTLPPERPYLQPDTMIDLASDAGDLGRTVIGGGWQRRNGSGVAPMAQTGQLEFRYPVPDNEVAVRLHLQRTPSGDATEASAPPWGSAPQHVRIRSDGADIEARSKHSGDMLLVDFILRASEEGSDRFVADVELPGSGPGQGDDVPTSGAASTEATLRAVSVADDNAHLEKLPEPATDRSDARRAAPQRRSPRTRTTPQVEARLNAARRAVDSSNEIFRFGGRFRWMRWFGVDRLANKVAQRLLEPHRRALGELIAAVDELDNDSRTTPGADT